MKVKKIYFRGGYSFKNFLGSPNDNIETLEIPDEIRLPVTNKDVLIKIGDKIKAGQLIAQTINLENILNPVVSSINGIVKEIDNDIVVIKSDNNDLSFNNVTGFSKNWESLKDDIIQKIIFNAGISLSGKNDMPDKHDEIVVEPEKIKHIIVQGIESDIFEPNLNVLLPDNNRIFNFGEGILILKKIYKNACFHIVLNKFRKKIIKEIDLKFCNEKNIQIYSVKPKYPFNNDKLLINTILKKDLKDELFNFNAHVLIFNVQTLLHIHDAVVNGKPFIEKIITLSGPGFKKNIHLKVRIGTPINNILNKYKKENDSNDDLEYRIIYNSPLTGNEIKDFSTPVYTDNYNISALIEGNTTEIFSFARPGLRKDSYSNTFLANFLPIKKKCNTNFHGEQRACLSCMFCIEICPAGIFPNLLQRYIIKDKIDELLIKYEIFKCINCNLCSYVCVSKIPIAALIKKGKQKMIELGLYSKREKDTG